MATLQIEFNCLCLFVCDPVNNVVHVLMPDTRNHNHGGHTHAKPDAAAVAGESQAGAAPTGESQGGEPPAAGHTGGEDAAGDAGLPRAIRRPADARDADQPVADSHAGEPPHAGHPAPSSGGEEPSGEQPHAGHSAPSSGGEEPSGEQPHAGHPAPSSGGENPSGQQPHAGHPAPSSGGEDASGEQPHAGHPAPSADGEEPSGEQPHAGHPAPSAGGDQDEDSDGEVEDDDEDEDEGGLPIHVVRLFRSDTPQGDTGIPLEGWTLELGPAKGEAVTDLTPPKTTAQIVDLDELTELTAGRGGRKVPKEMIDDPDSIATRITLRGGRLLSLKSEAVWKFGEKQIEMAHRGVWEIDGVPDELPWKSANEGAAPPLARLSDMGSEVDLPEHEDEDKKKGYRIRIFHVTEDGLPPREDDIGALDPEAVKHHFRVFYEVMKHPEPTREQLPEPEDSEGKTVNCGMAQAEIA